MKRAIFLHSFMLVYLVANGIAFGQLDAKKVCPFSITGLWRSEGTTEATRILFNFSPEGHVVLLEHSADTLPQDFEVVTSVNYKLDKPAAPKRIEFEAWRGNDAFLQGITFLNITDYSDDSFTTLNPVSGEKTRWVRVQMQLHFLTFAARSVPAQPGGPAFAMWTALDGRQPKVEALGVQLIKDDAGKTQPVFGPIPAELYEQVTEESDKDKKGEKDEKKDQYVIMRFELTQAEYEATHKVYEVWEKYVKTRALPSGGPYMNVMEFFTKAAEGLNQCGDKAKLHKLTQRERDEIASKPNPPQHPLEYLMEMRKKNVELHVTDAKFPWAWRPLVQLPGQ